MKSPDYSRRKYDTLCHTVAIITIFSFVLVFSFLYESILSSSIFLSIASTFFPDDAIVSVSEAYAQPYVETVKYRDLTIDLGNGLKTSAQLTIPAVGKGPFPGVVLVPGGGSTDMNYTLGAIRVDNKTGSKIYPPALFFQIAEYLSERGFAVLRYDKRGVGTNHTILDSNVWRNITVSDLKNDSEKALNVLLQQPEVNKSTGITLIGHSEGTVLAPRIAIDNPDKVKNIVLMASPALNVIKDNAYLNYVLVPLLYAQNVLDKNHSGLISVEEASKDPIFQNMVVDNLTLFSDYSNNVTGTNTVINDTKSGNDNDISINNELKPRLVKQFEEYVKKLNNNQPPISDERCLSDLDQFRCLMWPRSHLLSPRPLSVIGNVSSNIGILILMGENDVVEQAFLLQQRLAEINHPDHTLITYPNLGHNFYATNTLQTGIPDTKTEPIPEYVLADLYSWLEDHSRFTSPYSTAFVANNGTSSSNVTSSSSGK